MPTPVRRIDGTGAGSAGMTGAEWQALPWLLTGWLLDRLSADKGTHSNRTKPLRRILAFVLLVGVACRADGIFTEMSDSTFVQVMVALRKLPIGPADTVSRARQRDSVLKTFGVTAAQVESTAVRLASDPVRAKEIFQAIENPGAPKPPTK